MRHTLLPLHDRIVLRREYIFRIIIVLCFLLSLAGLLGISSVFPTFLKAKMLSLTVKSELASVKKDTTDPNLKEIQKSVAESLLLVDLLEDEDKTPKLSELVEGILRIRGDLRFRSFSANRVSTSTFTMNVSGLAPNRNSLISFKNRFVDLSPGNTLELPVSELAKSANIPFSLLLQQKIKQNEK